MIKSKKILIVSLCVSLSVSYGSSFAAIVSDNDGSAFVTKSEFESLKVSFANQINSYNDSIDKKIDGAISSYLTGIKLAKEPENYWDKLKTKLGGNSLVFKNKFKEIDSGDITTEVNLSITRDLVAKGEWGMTGGRRFFEAGWSYNPTTGQGTVYDAVWLHAVGGTNAGDFVEGDITARLDNLRTTDTDHNQDAGVVQQFHYDLTERGTGNFSYALSKCVFTKKEKIQASKTENIEGSGKAFIYRRAANGNIYLKEFANVWPILNIDVWRHDYKDFSFSNHATFQSYYRNDNGKAITDATINQTADEHHEYGAWTQGTKYEGGDETSGTYVSGNVVQMKANDGLDYSIFQYGTDFANNIYCLNDKATPVAETSTSSWTASGMTWLAEYFNNLGKRKQTNNFNDLKLTYTNIKQNTESKDPSTFSNEYITNVAGENVFLGGGAPLIYTQDDGQEVKVKLKFSSTGDSSDTVHYCVTDKQFVKGQVASGATVFKEGNAQVGTEVEINISSANKQIYWINMYSNTAGKDCTISDMSVTYK